MERQPKLTLIGSIVVVLVVAFWFLLVAPMLEKVRRTALRTVCGTQLHTLGRSMAIYSEDYDGLFPILPGNGPWSKNLGFAYDMESPDFDSITQQGNTTRTISASLYLLVRNIDVDPNHFVCPWSEQTDFKKSLPKKCDLTKLWDFGPDPYKHVSYSYHNPYGKYPVGSSRSAGFAVLADVNPWFQEGNIIPPGNNNLPPQIVKIPPELSDIKPWQTEDPAIKRQQYQKLRELWEPANSINNLPHSGFFEKKAKYSEGQNVLFGGGHTAFEKTSNVGLKNDNIYTYWSIEENPVEQDMQGGTAPTVRSPENDAKSKDDSFLVI